VIIEKDSSEKRKVPFCEHSEKISLAERNLYKREDTLEDW